MLIMSNADHANNNDGIPIKKSSFIIKKLVFIGVCFILLLIMIVLLLIMRNLTVQLLLLFIVSIIALILIIVVAFVEYWIELTKKNILKLIVNITCISFIILTVLFSASFMSPLKIGSSSFATFILLLICVSIIIGIFTLILNVLVIVISFIWKKCSSIRQQLSSRIVSCFIASFLTCPLFILIIKYLSGATFFYFGSGNFTFIKSYIIHWWYYSNHSLSFKFIYFLLLFAIGCIGVIVFLWLYLIDGYDMIIDVMIPSERFSNNITNDPSLNGNYSYSFVTYGSGYDERIDYGIKASIKTPTIDLSSIIKISSFNKKTFEYNESTLPFNSRIWYPTNNSGPYPIVLMVHGNHICTESSEIGYEYLGKMLASQGFIAVSIDENVLNDALPFYST
ncbi:unnamed protein product [Rotaria magnacalcarata]|uniref:Uncharacterized protein n=6 Tax=Rotaria magnacalcarata TaxID=392030 RepID=A0A814H4B1_9BILA|nr:unnamed protein product [Rotaria magnacalcarata]CAF3830360.1 unnamed protein product [Rotaria magnacalcarata]CAF4122303.1 unnamed protein product [Rotaria magnacalcarata]